MRDKYATGFVHWDSPKTQDKEWHIQATVTVE